MKKNTITAGTALVLIILFSFLLVGCMNALFDSDYAPEPFADGNFVDESLFAAEPAPAPRPGIAEKFSAYSVEENTNGQNVLTLFTEQQIASIAEKRSVGTDSRLTFAEVLFIIKDSMQLYNSFDVINFTYCNPELVFGIDLETIYPYHGDYSELSDTEVSDKKQQVASEVYRIILYRLALLHSGMFEISFSGNETGSVSYTWSGESGKSGIFLLADGGELAGNYSDCLLASAEDFFRWKYGFASGEFSASGYMLFCFDEYAVLDYLPDTRSCNVLWSYENYSFKYVWYTEEQLAEWFDTMIKSYKSAPESPDNKHTYEYFCLDGILSSYIGVERINKEATKFAGTEDYNVRAICEYFGIDKKTYTDLYDSYFDRLSAAKYGEMPDIFMFAYGYQYDAWFDGDYWENELFVIDRYKAPEYDTFHGEVPDGDNHTRRYYTVDWRLIEYVGTEKFEAWLADNPEASDRNIIKFISDFGITREQYDKIYAVPLLNGTGRILLPYNPYYLFGTEEMIKEYFTVHPLG